MSVVSPLAPKFLPDMPELAGVRIATAEAGIKYKNRTDLLFLVFERPVDVAGVFTRSRCPSAPVDHCRAALSHGKARGVVVNSGNANAFTGKKGREATSMTAAGAAKTLSCSENEIYIASTGVIGEPLDATRITSKLEDMANTAQQNGWLNAARAIMTTDTFPKLATRTVDFGGVAVTINGIAKGAGMIAPDMATMLSFIVTDAPVDAALLQTILTEGANQSFNAITVDSDTSTSDTLLFFATGTAEKQNAKRMSSKDDPRYATFVEAVNALLLDLATQIVKDGEGATKFLEIHVTGARSNEAAKNIAKSIANSPLVKTAAAGEDANWGRVVMAVGKSGEEAERDLLSIWFGEYRLACEGERDPDYSEEAVSAYMKNSAIKIRADIGLGQGEAKVWTCDLTKEYVAINGDYRS